MPLVFFVFLKEYTLKVTELVLFATSTVYKVIKQELSDHAAVRGIGLTCVL